MFTNTSTNPTFFKHGKGLGLSLPLVKGVKQKLTEASRTALAATASQYTKHEISPSWSTSNWQDKQQTVYWFSSFDWYTVELINHLLTLVRTEDVAASTGRVAKHQQQVTFSLGAVAPSAPQFTTFSAAAEPKVQQTSQAPAVKVLNF